MENKDIWAPFPQNDPEMIKKYYKNKGFATRFQNLPKRSNVTGIRRFPKRKNALRKPL